MDDVQCLFKPKLDSLEHQIATVRLVSSDWRLTVGEVSLVLILLGGSWSTLGLLGLAVEVMVTDRSAEGLLPVAILLEAIRIDINRLSLQLAGRVASVSTVFNPLS